MNQTENTGDPEQHEIQTSAEDVAADQAKTSKKKSTKKEKPTSVEALIVSALKSRKVSLALDELKRVKDHPHIPEQNRMVLLGDAVNQDETLDIARQLMVASLVLSGYPMVAEELREFARIVFVRHRCLQGIGETDYFPPKTSAGADELNKLLANIRKRGDETDRLVAAAIKKSEIEKEERAAKQDKRKDGSAQVLRKARDNAMIAMILWRFGQKSIAASEAVAALQENVFPAGKMLDRDLELHSLKLLTSAQDKTGISALLRWFSDRLNEEIGASNNVRLQLRRAQSEVAELRNENSALAMREEDLEEKLTLSATKLADLQGDIDRMKQDAHVRGVHHTDDLSRLRSRVIRLLEDEMQHLSESLTALSREQPKIGVAREYLGIVHDRLSEELQRLKEK